jgi:class 3 adenylate cyclase/tetratricopeptide (TPR) repeat protein
MPPPRCPACSRAHARSHAFCPYCGTPLKLQPELKQVSVLFADLCDSTRLIAGRTPEGAQEFLQTALDLMQGSIEAFGGTLSQDRGDGVVAVFGAPRAQEDHALRAALAALQMQRAAQAQALTLRIGIHSGEALVKLVADSSGAFRGLDGQVVHLAARLEQLARPGGVMVSHDTWRLLGEQVETRSLGLHAIRGFDERLELHELVDVQGASAAAPMLRRRRMAPLIGRDAALAGLMASARAVQAGRHRCVGIRGEAGVGKSRLLSEFCDRAALDGFAPVVVHCRAYLADSPLSAAAELAQALLRAGGLTPEALGSATAVPLLNLVGGGSVDDEWEKLAPRLRRQRIGAALETLLCLMAAARPQLVVVEDFFLADQESQRLIDAVLPRLQDVPVLVCLSYRPEFAHRWHDAPWFTEVTLPPLASAEMQRLAQALLGNDPSLRGVRDELVDRADGKPFFLEQLAISLVDDGTLVGPPGGYRIGTVRTQLPAPGSISVVTAAVVDRLPAPAKACLRAAAVLGGPIPRADVAFMTSLPDDDAAAALRACADAGLLRAASADGSAYEFRHALVQDAVLASLTRASAVTLRRAAYAALSLQHADDPRWTAVLARHAFEGELWADAAGLWARAISHSVLRSAPRDGLRQFQLGCQAASQVADRPLQQQLEMSLRLEVIGAQMPLGQVDEMLANLACAGDLAHALGDHRRLASVRQQHALLLWMRGRYDEGLVESGAALQAGHAADRRVLLLAAGMVRVLCFHGLGRYAEAAQLVRQVRDDYADEVSAATIPPGWATLPGVNLQAFIASALWSMDDIDGAVDACNEGYRQLALQDHPYSRGLVDFVQAQIWLERGRAADAEVLMTEAVQMCQRFDIPMLYPCVAALLGGAMALNGRPAEAIALLTRALDSGTASIGGTYGEFFLLHWLSVALLRAGRDEEAERRATQALRFAVEGSQFGHAVHARLQRGEALAALGRVPEALRTLQAARLHARRHGMPFCERLAAQRLAEVRAGDALAHALLPER